MSLMRSRQWEAGAMMMSLIHYWSNTGDSTYNDQVTEAIQHQSAENGDFMTRNQTRTCGNDDQAFWGFAAMEAAELKFPNPTAPGAFPWLALAQGVFNTQVPRWDLAPPTCGGGLKWQVFSFNNGYNYKNTISNGCFFALGARLGRYTENTTYLEWAEKAYDWTVSIGLIDGDYNVYDGADDTINCTQINHQQYSYVTAVYLHGSAYMYNHTQEEKWRTRVDGFLRSMERNFFPNGGQVIVETACEPLGTCNYDMRSFKAYDTRWLAVTAQLAPWTAPTIEPLLRTSAVGAAKSCTGTDNACGMKWTTGEFDGSTGPGEQMAAMSVISNLLSLQGKGTPPPVTDTTGGDSEGNPDAGGYDEADLLGMPKPITTGDRAGAGFITFMFVVLWLAGMIWVLI
ncbi:MAG: hypothetical protein Q9162_005832 [Coniocarpon cinnabarinum]